MAPGGGARPVLVINVRLPAAGMRWKTHCRRCAFRSPCFSEGRSLSAEEGRAFGELLCGSRPDAPGNVSQCSPSLSLRCNTSTVELRMWPAAGLPLVAPGGTERPPICQFVVTEPPTPRFAAPGRPGNAATRIARSELDPILSAPSQLREEDATRTKRRALRSGLRVRERAAPSFNQSQLNQPEPR